MITKVRNSGPAKASTLAEGRSDQPILERTGVTISQRQACITLIQKPGKDNRYLSSWRPISLINVDVKVIGKVLAKRLEKILPNIISKNQFAFVKGRNIDEAIRIITDVLEFT